MKMYGILPESRGEQYDMYDIINRIVDNSELDEYKPDYGKSIICTMLVLMVGQLELSADQRKIVKSKKKRRNAVWWCDLSSDSADKATRFIANCNQKKIPLVFFTRCNWFYGWI